MKKRILSLLILIFLLSTSLVFASDDVFDRYGIRKDIKEIMSIENVVELESKENVAIDKEWTVEFNQEIQLENIFSMSIKKGDTFIPVQIDLSGENEAKIIPVSDYEHDTNYTIYISLSNGKQYKMDFKTGKDILEVGEKIQFGEYNGEPIIWTIINSDENNNLMLFSDKGISVKPFDAPGDSHPANESSYTYGSNYWKNSNIRQWLNSELTDINWIQNAPVGELFTNPNVGYANEAGFLNDSNFTQDEKSLIVETKNKTLLNTLNLDSMTGGSEIFVDIRDADNAVSNYDSAYYEVSDDKVFLLSVKESVDFLFNKGINLKSNILDSERDRGVFAKGFWLRTPAPEASKPHVLRMIYDCYFNDIYREGASDSHGAIRPALYISGDSSRIISGEGTSSNPYIITRKIL